MADENSPENVKSALQLLYELEGKQFQPAQQSAPALQLQPMDESSARYGTAADVQPSTMSYPEQMRNVYETLRPTQQGAKDAAALTASGIYGAPMDIMGLVHGAKQILGGRIPEAEEMQLPGGSHYLEERSKQTGRLSQEPSGGAQAAGFLGSILADPMAAAGKLGTLAAAVPAAAKGAGLVEKALPIAQRELSPLGLYSHAAEVAAGMKQADKPEAVLSKLMGSSGVRKEELMAAGILDEMGKPTQEFLQQAKVNPQELAERIRTGAPDLKETVLYETPRETDFYGVFDSRGNKLSSFRTEEEAQKYASQLNEMDPGSDHYTRSFKDYDTQNLAMFGRMEYPNATTNPEGASNYRELLLQLPEREGVPNFTRSHHGENYPNVVAHMRMQDVPDPDTGQKILRIEEIQSDWAQKGRQQGFESTPAQIEKMKAELPKFENAKEEARLKANQAAEQFGSNSHEFDSAYKNLVKADKRLRSEQKIIENIEQGKGLPSAPYVRGTDQWAEMAIKRALKEAADNPEYTKMQLTAGDLQTKRWGESRNAEGVGKFYDTTLKKQLESWVKKLDPEAKVELNKSGMTREQHEEKFVNDMNYIENMKMDAYEEWERISDKINDPELLHGDKVELRRRKYEIEEELNDLENQARQRREEFGGMTTEEFNTYMDDLGDRMKMLDKQYDELEHSMIGKDLSPEEREAGLRQLQQIQAEYDQARNASYEAERQYAEHDQKFVPENFYEVTITPKMREAIAKGLPRFKAGGKVVSNLPKISDNPIVQRALALAGGRPANS